MLYLVQSISDSSQGRECQVIEYKVLELSWQQLLVRRKGRKKLIDYKVKERSLQDFICFISFNQSRIVVGEDQSVILLVT